MSLQNIYSVVKNKQVEYTVENKKNKYKEQEKLDMFLQVYGLKEESITNRAFLYNILVACGSSFSSSLPLLFLFF